MSNTKQAVQRDLETTELNELIIDCIQDIKGFTIYIYIAVLTYQQVNNVRGIASKNVIQTNGVTSVHSMIYLV